MRIFLTGGTGMVGTAVVKTLLSQGHEITTLARSDKSEGIQKAMGATPLRGSLVNPEAWVKEALTHEAFIHTAATFDLDMGEVDHKLVSQLLQDARALDPERKLPFIYTGGGWLYPESPVIPLTERHVLDPLPAFEWMLDSIEQIHQCPTFLLTVIHPALVVCPGRGLIASYARDLMENGEITYIDNPSNHMPFVQADDLADLYAKALEHRGNGLLLNAAGLKSAAIEEIGKRVAERCNLPYKARTISEKEAEKIHGTWAAGYARPQRMESGRARDLLGWEPKITSLDALVDDSLKGILET